MVERCNCRPSKWVAERTAWTNANPGRRFISCVDYKCNFFKWVEPPLCNRAQAIIPGLLKRINALEAMNMELSQQMEMSQQAEVYSEMEVNSRRSRCHCGRALYLLIVTWVLLGFYVLCKSNEVSEM